MELGNLVFGHSRGEYEIPREDAFEDPLFELLSLIGDDSGIYGCYFENSVFEVRPYWWGDDCTCGKEEPKHEPSCDSVVKRDEWMRARMEHASGPPNEDGLSLVDFSKFPEFDTANPFPECTCGGYLRWKAKNDEESAFVGDHAGDCYQTRLRQERDAAGVGRVFGDDQHIYEKLTAEFGLSMLGCAIHCTCGHTERCLEWEMKNPHAPDCAPHLPNFRHFESGLEVRWYKYALRDSYSNIEVTADQWAEIMRQCKESLTPA